MWDHQPVTSHPLCFPVDSSGQASRDVKGPAGGSASSTDAPLCRRTDPHPPTNSQAKPSGLPGEHGTGPNSHRAIACLHNTRLFHPKYLVSKPTVPPNGTRGRGRAEQGRHQPSPWPPGSSAPHPKLHPSRKSYINPSSRTPQRDPGPSTLRICLGPTDCGDKPGISGSQGPTCRPSPRSWEQRPDPGVWLQTLRQAKSPDPPTSRPWSPEPGSTPPPLAAQWPARCLQGSPQLPVWAHPAHMLTMGSGTGHSLAPTAASGTRVWPRLTIPRWRGGPKAPSPGSHPSPTTR